VARAAPAALAPFLVGATLLTPVAAEARRGEIDGLKLKPNEQAASGADAQAMGRVLLASGDPVKALAQFRQALAADPGSVEALNGMAVCYDRLGRYDVARSFYEAGLSLAPDEPMLRFNYGYSLFLQGDFDGAARQLGMAVASGDDEAQAAALAVLAKIDAARAKVRAEAPAAAAPALPEGPRVVRTSSYEQRLVLGGAEPAPVAVAALGEAAVAVVEIAALSAREEQRIALTEAALIRAEAHAEAQALLAARPADATPAPPWPEAMRRALALDALAAAAPAAAGDFEGFAASGPAMGPLPYLLEARRPQTHRKLGRRDLKVALLATGAAVQRKAPPLHRLHVPPPAEPLPERRSFEAGFDSDDGRLNAFAARVQGHSADVSASVAALEALIERLGRA
jgi:hypothetical protein